MGGGLVPVLVAIRFLGCRDACALPERLAHPQFKGILRDYAAVRAAFSSSISNGQVEGQVNRLKLIKRQMFGRATFDLLRQRVLHAV